MWWLLSFLIFPISFFLAYFKKERRMKIFRKITRTKQSKAHTQISNRIELIQILKENIGNPIIIYSKDFIHLKQNHFSEDNQQIKGKILEVDEDWLKLEYDSRQFVKKETFDQLILSLDCIERFSVISQSTK